MKMGLEEVKKSIMESATQQAEVILEQASKEAAKIEKEARDKAKELEKKSNLDIEASEKNLEKLKLSSVEGKAKHMVLERKKKLIDIAFEDAKAQAIRQTQKKRYLQVLIEKAQKELEVKTVYCSKSDVSSVKGEVSDEISAGIIAENEQKTIRLDYSYDTIFDMLKSDLLQDVAGILFNKK